MGKMIIIGMGTGDKWDLSYRSYQLLNSDIPKFARTGQHPLIQKNTWNHLICFDDVFEENDSLEEVYETIYQRLLLEAKQEDQIIYLVPGSPKIGDETVKRIRSELPTEEFEILENQSFRDKALMMSEAKEKDIKMIDVSSLSVMNLDIHSGILIGQLENQILGAHAKIVLSEVYPINTKIKVIDVIENKIDIISLYSLDQLEKYTYSTYIFVESIDNTRVHVYNINDLKNVMAELRGPEGCPWDRKQTHHSIRECVIEEAYEVVDAIDENDVDHLVEELGDLLLQVVFHCQMADEEGYFNFTDVTTAIVKKLYRRHPHVFGDQKANDSVEALKTWEEIKSQEKNQSVLTDSDKMDKIPKSMSPLTRSYKIQENAAKVGFDWPDISGAIMKMNEELTELMEAYGSGNEKKTEEELGDLLFAIVNFARFLKINPDLALNRTCKKFIDRFRYIEDHVDGTLKDQSLEEMDRLWEQSKRH